MSRNSAYIQTCTRLVTGRSQQNRQWNETQFLIVCCSTTPSAAKTQEWRNDTDKGNPKYSENIVSQCDLSIINPTSNGLIFCLRLGNRSIPSPKYPARSGTRTASYSTGTAGLHPQSPRHFAQQPSVPVSQTLRTSYLSHVTVATT